MKNTKHYMLYYKDKVYLSKDTIIFLEIWSKSAYKGDMFKHYFDLDKFK